MRKQAADRWYLAHSTSNMKTPGEKQRWFQVSVRSLLMLTLLVAAYLGGWMSNERRHAIQRRATPKTAMPLVFTVKKVSHSKAQQIEAGMKADELEMRARLKTIQGQRIRFQP